MGYKNLNTQDNIKRLSGVVLPLVLNPRLDYFTACPNPVTFETNVVSGKINEHRYEWSIVSGPIGKFMPNYRTLNCVFDPMGSKEKRVIKLYVDKNTLEEQEFTFNLYDIATSSFDSQFSNSSDFFPFYNEIDRAVSILDMNFSVESLPLYEELEKKISASSYGNLIMVNDEIWKVEIYSYPDLSLVETVYYPETQVTLINPEQRYLAKTWYKYDKLPPIYAWSYINIINVPTAETGIIFIVRNNVEIPLFNSESYSHSLLGHGVEVVNVEENVEPFVYNTGTKRTVLGVEWVYEFEQPEEPYMSTTVTKNCETANNSPRMQVASAGSGILTLLEFKTGTVG